MPVDESGGVVGEMPHISGTRVSVHHIVRAFRDRDFRIEEIADRVYPHLSEQDVREALTWVLDNPEEYHERVREYRATKERIRSEVATGPDDLGLTSSPDE